MQPNFRNLYLNNGCSVEIKLSKMARISSLSFTLVNGTTNSIKVMTIATSTSTNGNDWQMLFNGPECLPQRNETNYVSSPNILLRFPAVQMHFSIFIFIFSISSFNSSITFLTVKITLSRLSNWQIINVQCPSPEAKKFPHQPTSKTLVYINNRPYNQ